MVDVRKFSVLCDCDFREHAVRFDGSLVSVVGRSYETEI